MMKSRCIISTLASLINLILLLVAWHIGMDTIFIINSLLYMDVCYFLYISGILSQRLITGEHVILDLCQYCIFLSNNLNVVCRRLVC
jgi:hypothetical protein